MILRINILQSRCICEFIETVTICIRTKHTPYKIQNRGWEVGTNHPNQTPGKAPSSGIYGQ